MATARALADAGAPQGTGVLARQQTAGRGRLGRSWLSKHAAVYLTLILRPQPGQNLSGLPLVFGLAAHAAILAYAAAQSATCDAGCLGLKWPNDLYAHGRKLGGILLEAAGLDGPAPQVLVGVGINVAAAKGLSLAPPVQARYIGLMDVLQLPASKPAEDAAHVGGLAQHIVSACQHAHAEWTTFGLAPTVRRWDDYDVLRGQEVTAALGGREVTGRAGGIGACGRLRLHTRLGDLWVESGEVTPRATDGTPSAKYLGLRPETHA